MLNRILLISLLVAVAIGAWGWLLAGSRADTIKERDATIADRDLTIAMQDKALAERDRMVQIYAQAAEQANEFEKELNNDTNVDNLDVVPADYILKQLQSD